MSTLASARLEGWQRAIESRLVAAEAEIAALKAAEAARVLRQRIAGLRRGDAAIVGKLLPAIDVLTDAEDEFLARDLSDSEHPLIRELVKGLSNKAIGRLLGRAVDIPFGDLMLQARDEELDVRKYAVVRVFRV